MRVNFLTEDSDIYGNCPYSTSKAVCEMIAQSYYNISKNISIRTARAGNVLGGGDWSENRIIPDLVRSYMSKKTAIIRNPKNQAMVICLDIIIGYLIIGLDL